MITITYRDFLSKTFKVLHDPAHISQRKALLVIDFEKLPALESAVGFFPIDNILQQAFDLISNALHSNDIVGITGRHQICCLLTQLPSESHALLAAHKILRIFQQRFPLGERLIVLFPRIGIAFNDLCNNELNLLLGNAGSALQQAKFEHNLIKVYEKEEEDTILLGIDLWSDLGHAIEEGELILYYQPQIDVVTEKIISTEALIRWNHPQRGLIQPDQFIKLAEGTELMGKLTLWVLNTALRHCASYRNAGLDAGVSINFSADNLLDPELPDLVMQGIEIWKVPPDKIMIELTESAIMEDKPGSLEILHELKALGLKLAMDDFGTGFSSMARLLNLPLDEIKIDMMFVKDMLTSPTHERIVDSMISLGHQLNLIVVAEGVEDDQTYERLKQLGCDVIQGYFVGRPVPLTELIQRVVLK